jgi:hypothetical protein
LVSATLNGVDVSGLFTLTVEGVLTTTGNVDLPQGQSLTLVVSAIAKDSNVPGTIIADTATLTYTSLDGTPSGERTGADGSAGHH